MHRDVLKIFLLYSLKLRCNKESFNNGVHHRAIKKLDPGSLDVPSRITINPDKPLCFT